MNINHKVSFVSIGLLLLMSFSALSQNIVVDSLKGIIETGIKDTAMVMTLNALSLAVLKENISEAKLYAEEANELATQINFKKGKAYSLKNIGLAAYYQGDYLEVLDFWTESLETFEEIQDTIGIAKLVNNLGAVYYSQGSHPKALDYYLRSLSLSEKTKDPFNIVQALLNLGGLYTEMQDYEKALMFFNRIEDYRPSLKNSELITSYLMGEGEVYFELGLYDDALKYYEEALTNNENIALRSDNLIKLGLVEFSKGKKEKAINYLNEAYQIAKFNNQQSEVIQALIGLASVHKQDNYKMALAAYSEAEILAKEIEANDELRDIYKGFSETYKLVGKYSDALKYQTLYIDQKDLLFNIETDDKIRGLQFDFDLEKKEDEIGLLEKEAEIQEFKEKRQKNIILAAGIALFLIVLFAISLYRRYKFTKETNLIIEKEKDRSEKLLLNILPEETAQELKEFGKVKAKRFDSVTVLFTDFVGFTAYAQNLEPEELVSSVDYYFSKFDAIMEKYDVEKIKTIGDAYMCVSGLPEPGNNDVFRAIQAAFEIVEFIEDSKKTKMKDLTHFDVRIGVNTGSIVAGVVGTKKFAYDIWGDSVNVASRMETKSLPGKINVSEKTYELIKDVYDCEYRGEIEVKNKGMMKMYFVNGVKDKAFLNKLELTSSETVAGNL